MFLSKKSLFTALGLWAVATEKHQLALANVKECSRGKLVILDRDNPRVALFDADTPNHFANPVFLQTHHTTIPSRRVAKVSETEQFVSLVNIGGSDQAGGVSFLDTGVTPDFNSIGVTKGTPKMLDFKIDCTGPVHNIASNHKIGQFCDGQIADNINSTVWIVDESLLAASDEPGSPSPLLHTQSLPGHHHGIVAPILDDHMLVSVANDERAAGDEEASTLPDGFEIIDYNTGEVVHGINVDGDPQRSCKGMHGDAHFGNTFAFACDQTHGGILVVHYGSNPTYSSRLFHYPEGYDEHRTSFVKASRTGSHFVGTFNGGGQYGLVAFDPVHDEAQLTEHHVQHLSAASCDAHFERSGGDFFFVWLATGNLQVYAIDPWTLISDVQVVDGMSSCDDTIMFTGHGYAYVHAGSHLYAVDVRDPTSIAVRSHDIGIEAHTSIPLPENVVAGVPPGYECAGPEVPHTPHPERSGAMGYLDLCFDKGDPALTPGSEAQTVFLRKYRADLSKHLSVGIDRIYIDEFHGSIEPEHGHHDHDESEEDAIVKLFFADAGPHDVNQVSGETLKAALNELLTSTKPESREGTLEMMEGTIVDDIDDILGHHGEHDDEDDPDEDDGWPAGAKAAVGVVGAACVGAVIAAIVFKQKESAALSKVEQVKAAELEQPMPGASA